MLSKGLFVNSRIRSCPKWVSEVNQIMASPIRWVLKGDGDALGGNDVSRMVWVSVVGMKPCFLAGCGGGAAKELVVSRLIGMVEQEIYSREAFKPPCCGM